MTGAVVVRVGGVPVTGVGFEGAWRRLWWTSGFAVDADGCPHAYALPGSGLRGCDYLGNAHRDPRDLSSPWCGVVVGDDGEPLVQITTDPCPGYLVSTTSLHDVTWPVRDPRRYVDSDNVPYLAVPPELLELGVRMGDLALVEKGDRSCAAVVADRGPRRHLGEGSMALARALDVDPDPRRGGCSGGVLWSVWPGTSKGWPRDMSDVGRDVMSALGLKSGSVA